MPSRTHVGVRPGVEIYTDVAVMNVQSRVAARYFISIIAKCLFM